MNIKLNLTAAAAALACSFAAAQADAASIAVEAYVVGHGSNRVASDSTVAGSSSNVKLSETYGGVPITASADWVTGSIRGTIKSLNSTNGGAFDASIYEQFEFNVAGASADAVTRIGFRTYFDGGLKGGWLSTRVDLETRIYTSQQKQFAHGVHLTADSRNYFYATNPYIPALPVRLGDPGEVFGTYHNVTYFDFVGPTATVFISTGVSARAEGSSSVDFGNSAHFGFVLPETVTFTSASGNALTVSAFPGGVPEPATWAMMISGFGMLGAAARRRTRTKIAYD